MEEELLREFLDETICNLKDLQDELASRAENGVSRDFLRKFFRRIHTIKGTAQSLGRTNLSRFAHRVENILHVTDSEENLQTLEVKQLIENSLNYLLGFCKDENYAAPQSFVDKLMSFAPAGKNSADSKNSRKLPENILRSLSAQEAETIYSALENGNLFHLLEVFFAVAEFNEGFKEFRAILNEKGEIIAVAPGEEKKEGKLGFRVFFVSKAKSAEILRAVSNFAAKSVFTNDSPPKSIYNLNDLLANLIEDARKKAKSLGKEILFEFSGAADRLSKSHLILINYLALHLLRNAVDHAIETPEERLKAGKSAAGKITLEVSQTDKNLSIKLRDDGRGIDADKIALLARAKGVVEENLELSEQEKLHLIFTHGFSTSESVSEISGRGIGLDAVRDFVENAGGRITVQTEIARGTIFEINLPV